MTTTQVEVIVKKVHQSDNEGNIGETSRHNIKR